jgi:hypothetical protein
MVSGHTLSSLVSINSASDFQITIVTIIVYVRKSDERIQETGSVVKSKSSGRPPVAQDIVEDIRKRIEDNPNISLRRLTV